MIQVILSLQSLYIHLLIHLVDDLEYMWAWQDLEMKDIFIELVQNYNSTFGKGDILNSNWGV